MMKKKKEASSLTDLESAPERALKAIRKMISEGQLESGQRIDQRELAKKLGLTTVPIREALCWLEAEGLVQRIPGRGVFCKMYTVKEIEELIEIRGALEGLAAAWASQNITIKKGQELSALAKKLSDEKNYDSELDLLKDHILFHEKIVAASGSERLISLLRFTHITENVLGRIVSNVWPVEAQNHLHIVEAILSGDPDKARSTMQSHIAPTYTERLAQLREQYGDNPII